MPMPQPGVMPRALRREEVLEDVEGGGGDELVADMMLFNALVFVELLRR